MTISSTTTKNQYTANGSTTAFAYAFKIFADADIKVIVTTAAGVESVKSLSSDYTVSGAGSSSGGNVTFGTAPANGETVTLLRNVAITQSVDYVANDAFPAEAHEGALDRLTAIAQQQDALINTSIRVPQSDGSATLVLPNKATRAGGFLSFDSTGNVAINSVANLNFLNLESLTIDNLKLDANTFSSLSGNITVDSAGDINLDNAALSSVNFLNAGTAFAELIGTSATSELRLYGDAIGTLITLTAEHVTNSSTIARLKTDNAPLYLDTDLSGTIYLQTTISSANDLIKLDTSTADTLKISTSTTSSAAGDEVFILSNTGLVIDGSVTATAFSGPITGDVTGNAATASQVAVAESGNTNTDYEIVFVTGPGGGNESLFIDNATLEYNPYTETLKVPRIYVASVTSGGAGTISFEGATEDSFETTLIVTDPTGDRTITLPDATGTVVLSSTTNVFLPLSGGTLTGGLSGTTGTFSGAISATNGTFSGNTSAVGGTFSGDISAVNATLTGYLRGPSSFVLDPATHGDNTGTVVIAGNLQIDGTTTTINSTTLDVDDKNITVAAGAANAAAADQAGLTIDGANIEFKYNNSGAFMSLNAKLEVSDTITCSSGFVGNASSASQVNVTDPSPDTDANHFILGVASTGTGNKAVVLDGGVYFNPSINRLYSSSIFLTGAPTGGGFVGFEGATANSFETFLFATDPTADRAIYLPDAAGTLVIADSFGDITLGDSDKIFFGADGDASIHGGGSGTSFTHGSSAAGDLNIKNDKADSDTILWADGGSGSSAPRLRLHGNTGAVSIKHYTSTKLATTSTGIDITGNATFDDNGKAIFGAGSDLQIYHDGNHSYIVDQGTGHLKVFAEHFFVNNSDDTEQMIGATVNGAVDLFFDGSNKLATTSTGINVTGTAEADGMKIDNGSSHPLLTFNQSAAANQVASKLIIGTEDNSVNALSRASDTAYILADEGSIRFDTGSGNASAGYSFNGGNVSIGSLSSATFHVSGDEGSSISAVARFRGTNTTARATRLQLEDYSGGIADGIIEFAHPNASHTGAYFGFGYNGSSGLRFDVNNDATFGGTVTASTGGSSTPSFTFSGDTNTGMFKAANDTIGFTTGGTERVQIGSFGVAADTLTNKTASGGLTLDAAGDIILDADSGNWRFKDAGTSILEISRDSNTSVTLFSAVSDMHILFKGNDGGSPITAMTLDMSEAGDAAFNRNVGAGITPIERLHSAGAVISTGSNATGSTSGAERAVIDLTSNAARIGHFRGSTSAGSGSLELYTDSSKRLTIDAEGEILHTLPSESTTFSAGTESTWNRFEIFQDRGAANTASGIAFRSQSGTAPAGIVSVALNTTGGREELAFITSTGNASSEVMRLDENGNVGIGVSPSNRLHALLDSSTTNDTVDVMRIEATSSGTPAVGFGPTIRFQGDRPAGSSDMMGRIGFVADNMTSSRIDGAFVVETGIDGTPTERMRIDSSGNIIAKTGEVQISPASGTAKLRLTSQGTGSEVFSLTGQIEGVSNTGFAIRNETDSRNDLIIDGNGNVLVGATSNNSANAGHGFQPDGFVYHTRDGGAMLRLNRLTSDGAIQQFQKDGSTVGSIDVSGSATSYNTSSDHRLKENVMYDWDATTRLKQLKPARFNFIVDPDTTVDGFLAHEAQAVVPEAITGTKDEVDDDGNAVMQGIDQSKLVPLLVKTIQELEARITALEGA